MIAEMEAQVRARIGDDAIFGVGDDRLEAVTTRLLAQAGVRLALVESATGGEVARLLQSTAEGRQVVTAAHVVDGPAALAALLDISPAQLDAFDWVSQMSATAAAARLIDTYEGGWGLAVLGDMGTHGDVYGEETGQTFVALATPGATEVRRYPYGGDGFLARRWVTVRTVDLLRRQALAKLEAGGWKLETGSWKLEAGNWKLYSTRSQSALFGVCHGYTELVKACILLLMEANLWIETKVLRSSSNIYSGAFQNAAQRSIISVMSVNSWRCARKPGGMSPCTISMLS